MFKVLTVIGTRPEAIKLAPVVLELRRHAGLIEGLVCATAQHREMLDQVLKLFRIAPDVDLDLMEENQGLARFAGRALEGLSQVMEEARPDLVLVQGDTTTSMIAALAAFYHKIPVGHVEAGLRTRNRYFPFPEEINRHLTGVLASYHFAPTETAAEALRREGVLPRDIYVTGNTVIDALLWVIRQPPSPETADLMGALDIRGDSAGVPAHGNDLRRTILVTAHRRENFGEPLERICLALREIVQRNPDVQIVYPVHLNPNVRGPVYRLLGGKERVHLMDPLPYEPFAHLMNCAYIVVSDSGGIQEEAPALGKPVLVLREETERPEAVEAGTVRIVGTNTERIVAEAERLLHDPAEYSRMAHAIGPYGDGHASERITGILLEKGRGET